MQETRMCRNLIIILLAVSITSVFFLLINKICYETNIKPQTNVSAADLTISNYSELSTFAASVNGGNNYYNKTVELSSDIDCLNNFIGINSFAGTFDGKGYKIYNAVTNGRYHTEITGKQNVKHNYYAIGLFGELTSTAIVKNLKIKSVTSSKSLAALGAVVFGGIAGRNSGEISYCHVEDYSTSSPGTIPNPSTSGIFACGGGLATNCFSKNIKMTAAGAYPCISGIGPSASIYQSQNTSALGSSGARVQKCVAVNNGYTYSIANTNGVSVENCYSSKDGDGFINLSSISSVGGAGIKDWYYASNYNGGWPVLRVFIKTWSKLNFTCSPEGSATSPSSIMIPSDATEIFTSSNPTIVIYDQVVTANTPVYGYKFKRWECLNSTNYRAVYEYITCTVKLNATVGNTIVSPTATDISVLYGTKVTFSANYKTNVYYYYFTNPYGQVTTVRYDLRNHKPFIICNFGVSENATITSDINITPSTTYKDYNVVFK